MRFAQRFGALMILLVFTVLTGCASYFWPTPTQRSAVDQNWGSALESNIAKMTANPDAGQVGEPIALDPHTGELVGAKYYESQKTKTDNLRSLESIIQIDSD